MRTGYAVILTPFMFLFAMKDWIKERLSVRTGAIGTMVSCNCVVCHHDNKIVLEVPTLLWFGEECHTPLVCVFSRVVVDKGLVWLNGIGKCGVKDIL